ncbi:MAG TPA: vanadium-dependent haloperoxidase [Blastocatellia bacterium]|nr:vanadium-dependent haloperoxidase [Blastocatellia bacterium]
MSINKIKTIMKTAIPSAPDRRAFIVKSVAGVAAGIAGLSNLATKTAQAGESKAPAADSSSSGHIRRNQAYQIRLDAARSEKNIPVVDHPANGDELLYANRIANYSKGLPHNSLGEVDLAAYASLIRAISTGNPAVFESINLGGSVKLTNPQAGLAFDMQGPDSHSLTMRPAPAFSSAEEAAEIAENYWMALTRDIPFSEYGSNPLTIQAAQDLSSLSDFRGPKFGGQVTPGTLFRGTTSGDLTGPYISQFMWKDTPFGAEQIDRRMRTTAPGLDYMTSYADWLAIQNGAPAAAPQFDSSPRYIRNGRDLGEWVHIDVLFQAYFNALLILLSMGAPVDAANPYRQSRTQIGFGTLGDPYIASVLCAVATRALKAVWYQKWFVHRRLRPEAFAGRVHIHLTQAASYPIHVDIQNSAVLDELFSRNGTYLLPMAFPEGSPTHPAYGAGHATVAGACVTILKAFFDESYVIPDPVEASADGLHLVAYGGPDLTVGGELNKLASNVAIGRNIAGVHWRSDATESLRLGEEIAIRYLREEHGCFNERFDGFGLTRFDGTTITV